MLDMVGSMSEKEGEKHVKGKGHSVSFFQMVIQVTLQIKKGPELIRVAERRG